MNATVTDFDEAQQIDLLRAIASGNEGAFADFYRFFENNAYRFALKKLNDPHAASDVVNETMLAIWNGKTRYEGRSKVRTWLFGIVHNKSIDRIRRDSRHQHSEIVDDAHEDEGPTAFDAVAATEDSAHVRECLTKLNDEQKQVMHLAFFEELAYWEIAGIVEIPEGTVKTRVYHAKRALKRCLARLLGLALDT